MTTIRRKHVGFAREKEDVQMTKEDEYLRKGMENQ